MNILKTFLIWRILLFIPVIAGFYLLDYGNSYPFFEVNAYQKIPDFLNVFFIKVWANFDGVHYLNIALDGYKEEARFFPLLPIIIYLISFGGGLLPLAFLTALILPNLFFIGALFMFYKLLKLDYSEEQSGNMLPVLLVFPTAFFFVSIYTESLFLLLLLTSLYFARKEKWVYAISAAFLLCLTRFVGIFIIPALFYEYLIKNKILLKNLPVLFSIIFITPLGILFYAIFNNYHWHNFLYFLTAHTEIGNSRSATSLIFPLQTVYRYFKILTTIPINLFDWWVALLELSAFIFGSIMLFVAWKKKIRVSYLIFGILAFLLPVLSGTFSGLPRYIVIILPVFIALGLIRSKTIMTIYFTVSIVLLFILLMFFTKGYFIA